MSKKDKKETNKAELPSIFKMASNFAKDLTKYVKEGAPNVTHKQYLARLEACKKCPHLIAPTMRCGKCGCMLEHKAKWRTTTCPDNPQRWDPLYLSPEDLVKMETAKEIVDKEDKEIDIDNKRLQEHLRDKKHKEKIKKANQILQKAYEEGKFKPEDFAGDDAQFIERVEERAREGYPFSSITQEEADRINREADRSRESKPRKGDIQNPIKGENDD